MLSGSYHFLLLRIRIKWHFPQESPGLPGEGLVHRGHRPSPSPPSSREAAALGCSVLGTGLMPLCLLPRQYAAAEAPWSRGLACGLLLSSLGLSQQLKQSWAPVGTRGRMSSSGMLPASGGVLPCSCLLSIPSSSFSTLTVLWGPPLSPYVDFSPLLPHTSPRPCSERVTPGGQLEHYKNWFRNGHRTPVPWEPNMRLKSGAFDEIVGKQNLLPLGWPPKWDVWWRCWQPFYHHEERTLLKMEPPPRKQSLEAERQIPKGIIRNP